MFHLILLLLSTQIYSSICGIQDVNEAYYLSNPIEQIISSVKSLLKLIPSLIKFFKDYSRYSANEIDDHTPDNDHKYDFVIIGAGSAGATIASRLSEIENVSILLIEAGYRENLVMDIPLIPHYLQLSDEINWKYEAESSNNYCRGMKSNRCKWPRGKVMGGSSVLNYMIATRGNPLDYDEWAAMGNKGWSYAELLKYFKKLEEFGIKEYLKDTVNHNTKGPLPINYPNNHTSLADGFLEAGLELGYPIIDYNGNQSVGYSYLQTTTKNGERISTNRAYLQPIRSRKNLFVTQRSHVNKILIDQRDKRAYGVQFSKSNLEIQVRAKKEVILCAGAINSPQILLLSGIGPSDHLKKMGIDVIQNAPVGENLMDHIVYGGLIFLIDQPLSLLPKEILNPLKPHITDYLEERKGPMSIPGTCEALSFIDVDKLGELDTYPNIELLFAAGSIISDPMFRITFGISDRYWSKTFKKILGRHSWTICPMLLRPKSRGRILLQNRDPSAKPRIYANYLNDPEDVRIAIKGIRAAIQVSKTKAMQRFNSQLYNASIPGCEMHLYDSDDYWECALRTYTFTFYHPAGTCKMAPKGDPSGVVDPRLRVSPHTYL